MSSSDVVETIHGKYSKYEIVKKEKVLGGADFYVRKDGKPAAGSFSSLRAAVEWAKEKAG